MKYLQASIIGLLSLLFLTQYSVVSESETPRVNYSGILNGIYVENITIAGLTDRIKFYLKPTNPQLDKLNETELSLSRIKTIMPPNTKPAVSTYGSTKYVEVIVTDKDNNQRTYLIEKDKGIKATEKNGNKDTVFFGSLERLEIQSASCDQK